MSLLSTIIFLLLWTASAEAHPLHLSITNITYENGKLKISMKTFYDDWEVAYFHYHGSEIDLTDEERQKDPWITEYLTDRFKFAQKKGDEAEALTIESIKISEESMLMEMSVDLREKPNSLYIYNALLTDIFPDQTNLVIFEFNERESGIKFDIRKHEEVVELE